MRFFVLALTLLCATPAIAQQVRSGQRTTTYMSYVPNTATAQGVAELQASRCAMGHCGGNSGYEGVGMGSTPEAALNNCCYSRSGMRVVDQGVARGRNGMWYACRRYR